MKETKQSKVTKCKKSFYIKKGKENKERIIKDWLIRDISILFEKEEEKK